MSRELLIQHLRTATQEFLKNTGGGAKEARPEDYIVRALIDFEDVNYDVHSDLLYELAGQLVKHLRSYLVEVLAKKAATLEWCKHATEHAKEHGGKTWRYLLIPHDAITGNMTLAGLASRYAVT